MVVWATCDAHWSSSMINIRIWTHELVIVVSWWMVRLIMNLNISLTKLVQNWSGSLCVNCWYLSHYLSIWTAICVLSSALDLLVGADLWRTTFVSVLPLILVLVWWSVVAIDETGCTALLIIDDSCLFQGGTKVVQAVSVTCKESIPSVLSQLAVSHLFGFLNLLRI